MGRLIYIYTLSDPSTNTVKYIGKTVDIKQRYKDHIKVAKSTNIHTPNINWVRSLINEGKQPIMEIIDEIDCDWEWLEQYWISQFKTWGFNLKNITDGGDTNPMNNPTSRKKVSDKLKGVAKSQEHNDKISKSKLGVSIHSEEQKRKYSENHRGGGNPMFGVKHNKSSLLKMKIPVLQYDLDGNFIKEWTSAADIQRENNSMLAKSINRCAKGNRATAYGYKWEYKNKKGRG